MSRIVVLMIHFTNDFSTFLPRARCIDIEQIQLGSEGIHRRVKILGHDPP